MADKAKMEKIHKYFAVNLFNGTWEYIDKTDRTPEQDLEMIHMAHASLYHWMQIGGPTQIYTGEWQVSRVYAIAKMGESALKHGLRSLQICVDNDMTGFNKAFAYEAVARAYSVLGDNTKKDEYIALGKKEAESIDKAEDKEYLLGDLKNI